MERYMEGAEKNIWTKKKEVARNWRRQCYEELLNCMLFKKLLG
jgi:hypothetical protein